MIAHLSGTVIDTHTNHTVLDVQGVGYLVYVNQHALANCIPGSSLALHVHTVVREQALDLYGFVHAKEKEMFELLITISGIGPKVALGILGATTLEDLIQAVRSKNSGVLTKVSGIGKKNAEKIILELENKIDNSWCQSAPGTSDDLEVFEALEALGYKPRAIQQALREKHIQNISTTQERIRTIMRHLS